MPVIQPTLFDTIFKEIPGRPGYLVGDDGRILSNRSRHGTVEWHPVKSHQRPDGYCVLVISPGYQTRYVHRLVLEAFVGPCPEGMEACHNDGNRANNRADNLRWDTRKENQSDRKKHGTFFEGEQIHFAKLTASLVRAIRAEYKSGTTQVALSKKYGVRQTNISMIVTRQTWKHI